MTRFWIIALVATVPTSRGQQCDEAGTNAGVTQITFGPQPGTPLPGGGKDDSDGNTELVYSNLGGTGGFIGSTNGGSVSTLPGYCDVPDNAIGCFSFNTEQPRELLFRNVGKFNGLELQLKIINTTLYTPETFQAGAYLADYEPPMSGGRQNRIQDEFGQINIGANTNVTLRFEIEDANTGDPVTLTAFTMVMYDFDTGACTNYRNQGADNYPNCGSDMGEELTVEYLVVCDASRTGTSNALYGVPSTIVVDTNTGMNAEGKLDYRPGVANAQTTEPWTGAYNESCTAIHATTAGVVADNPSLALQLTEQQQERAFLMLFEGKSSFEITVGSTGYTNGYGRNMMFAGVNLLPPCPPPPAGGPSPPPSPPPFPPPFPPTYEHVSARRDPHFTFAHGGHADFKGEDGAVYNLVSAKNVSFNAKFVYDDFNLPRKLVHGSYMGAVFWTFRTYCPKCDNWGPKRRPRIITVMFNASAKQPNPVVVRESGKPDPFYVYDGAGTWRADNVMVSVHGHGSTAVVSDGRWKFSASSKEFPNPAANPGKYLLHVNVDTLYDADKDVVAPHGIIGQSYDGDKVGVDGAQDDYRNAGSEMSTAAQAEGAIEGVAADYKVTGPFATDFKYSRFDAVSASARDLSTLKGKRVPLVPGHAAGAGTLPEPESSATASGSVEDDEVSADAITKSINRIHPQLSS